MCLEQILLESCQKNISEILVFFCGLPVDVQQFCDYQASLQSADERVKTHMQWWQYIHHNINAPSSTINFCKISAITHLQPSQESIALKLLRTVMQCSWDLRSLLGFTELSHQTSTHHFSPSHYLSEPSLHMERGKHKIFQSVSSVINSGQKFGSILKTSILCFGGNNSAQLVLFCNLIVYTLNLD